MAKPASSAVINPGEPLFIAMTACWPMLEGTGTTSADKAGTRTLTFAGGGTAPTWSTDGAGDPIIAIGTAQANPLSLASSLTLGGSVSFSLAFRFKQTSDDNQSAIAGTTATNGFLCGFGGANYMGVRSNVGTDANYTLTSFTADANYVLAYDQPAGAMRLYKDGVEVSSVVSVGTTFALTIDRLGNGYSGTTFALVGSLTYLYAWDNLTLDLADAAALHANPYFGLTEDPVLFISPEHGEVSRPITLTLNGYDTTWLSESPVGLFTVSGGSGASISSVSLVSDILATATLNPGTALGTLTITDTSTAATSTFEVVNVFAGGILSTTFANNAGLSGSDATGRTFVALELTQRIRQHGPITQVRALINAVSGTGGVRFKVFRPNGSNFDYVSQSELLTPAGTGTQTFDLASPMECQPGDILGVWLQGTNEIAVKTAALVPSIKWDAANQTGTNWNPGNSVNNFSLCMDYRTAFVTAIDTGDSRSAGHNGASYFYTFYETGPAGPLTAQPINVLQALIDPTRTDWTYQNFAKGSQTWAHVAGTQFPDIFTTYNLTPSYIFTQCGVNDVAAGRTNAAVLADMDTCYAMLPANTYWLIDEIQAWTAGNDAQAAALRSMNAAMAAWAVGKDRVYITSCHDEMAQLRVSTGQLDDMLAAYDYDGVHMTNPAGVDELGALRLISYDSIEPTPPAGGSGIVRTLSIGMRMGM